MLHKRDPDVVLSKVYHPQHGEICVHQSGVCKCPDNFPAGYYWYGGKQKGPGRPPKWVEQFLDSGLLTQQSDAQSTRQKSADGQSHDASRVEDQCQDLLMPEPSVGENLLIDEPNLESRDLESKSGASGLDPVADGL